MLFKDVKQNYPVYILDKQELTFSQGKVMSVGFPRMDVMSKPVNPINTQMVIDVTVENGGKSATYTIPEGLSITYAGNIVLSTDKEGLVREIEAMKNSAESIINSMDKQKQILDKSNKLLSELNPAFKEKQEVDSRFANIENSINEMKEMFNKFLNTNRYEDNNNTPQ